MTSAERTADTEHERLEAVRRYQILDTPPDGSFDRITELAALLLDVPIAIVAIVDEDRLWFKSCFGVEEMREVPRDASLSTSVNVRDAGQLDAVLTSVLGMHSYLAAELKTFDGFRLGTLCVLDRRDRHFSAEERTLLKSLAGIVMDQLELRLRAIHTVSTERQLRNEAAQWAKVSETAYLQERALTKNLQQAMLPRAFPVLEKVQFDAVYVPAEADVFVGGDWYDAFLVDDSHLLLSIGDVSGHGIHAASLMGTLRPSLRALGLTERSPRALLQSLDRLLLHEHDEVMVTCFVALVDLSTMTLRFANAGHPPALLFSQTRGLRELAAAGAPLGLRSNRDPEDAIVHLAANDLLVCYTDGLTESERDIIMGEQMLKGAVARFGRNPVSPAHQLRNVLLPRGNRNHDDVAIMSVFFE